MFKKNQLDEMQELKLLKIEHNGCWIAYVGLLIVLMIQVFAGVQPMAMLPLWLLFMGLSFYLAIACARAGIWDRHLGMDPKTNLKVSLFSGLAAALVVGLLSFLRFHEAVVGLISGGIMFAFCFILCFIALQLAAKATKKRQEALNAEPEDETL